MDEMFESAIRSAGNLAGVFEFDGDTGYFYLYRVGGEESDKILGAIQVSVGTPEYSESDIEIIWSGDERLVFLLICGRACAAFDSESRCTYGGRASFDGMAALPDSVLSRLPAQGRGH